MALSNHEAKGACAKVAPETKGYFMQQTMMRIKDPKRSLDFYTRVMGMTLLKKLDFDSMEFSLYFLAYVDPAKVPEDPDEATKFCFTTPATIELTHNYGTEKQEGEVYHNGNSDPRGFGHIGIVVPDVDKACERFESLGVSFVKKPNDDCVPRHCMLGHFPLANAACQGNINGGFSISGGNLVIAFQGEPTNKGRGGKMKGLAFIKDPDGYWIEILNPMNMVR